jgi:peptide/nickel transport system substrate-binding protein
VVSFRNGPPSIGSGPFKVVENKPGIYTKLVANEDYWAGRPHIDELVFQTYENADTMVQDLKSGTIDAAVGVPGAQFQSLGSVEGITANAGTSWSASQISFNCYDSPDSKGNPVLLDQRFRQALQWAVDRERLVEVAFSGHAYVGQALLPPYFKYKWEPTPDQAYSFDPEKARSLLEAAGYKDVDGNGNRETKDDMEAMEEGALTERIWGYSGDTFTPDYDMYTWYWLGGGDPTFILSLFTPEQIGNWSDTSWTDPAYTALFARQSTLVDEPARIEAVQEMQQIVHEASPWITYGYPQLLEAYNTGEWEGYVPAPSGFEGYAGAVMQNPDQIDTYLSLEPKAAGATETSGSRSWIVIVVIVVVVGAAIVVWLLLRGRGKAVEEG